MLILLQLVQVIAEVVLFDQTEFSDLYKCDESFTSEQLNKPKFIQFFHFPLQ